MAAILAGVASAAAILTVAGRLGAVGLEWHRFLVYGAFFVAMAAVPGLWLMLRDRGEPPEQLIGVVLAAGLVATLPTTRAFVDAQRGAVACILRQEAEAFASIGRVAGRDRVVLLDRCFIPGPFRVYSGARTMFVNLGIAVPRTRT